MSAPSLQQAYPDEALAWHSTKNGHLKPEDVTISSHKKVWWQCIHATTHIWEEAVKEYLRPKKGGKCPYCDNRRALAGDNDLATTNPDLAKQWHPTKNADLSPYEITARSSRSVAWLGNCGHEWAAPVSTRTLKGRGCPYCTGRLVLPGFNDLATTDPDLVMQWHPNKNVVSPREVSRGSTQSVWWICSVDPTHEWKATPNSRTNNGTGCSVCSGHRVLTGFNDVGTTHPHLVTQWHPSKNHELSPAEISQGGRHKVWWVCPSGHEWEALISDRSKGHGCPKCANIVSKAETELREIMESWDLEVIPNTRSQLASGMELDIYLPEKKFAIEFNGLYWHSEEFKERKYHQEKQRSCDVAGVTLYQVWEDDWKSRRDIVLRGIAHRLGITDKLHKTLSLQPHYTERIGARSTIPVTLFYDEAALFLAQHHIQGGVTGTHYLGLVDRESG